MTSSLPEALQAFDLLPLSFWMSEGRTGGYKIVAWNKGAERIYGYPASQVLGRSYLDVFVEEAELVRQKSMHDADAVISGTFQHPRNCLAVDQNALGQEIILLTNVFRYELDGQYYQAEIAVDLTPSGFLRFLNDDYRARRLGPNHEQERTLEAFVRYYMRALEDNRLTWTRTFAHEIRTHLATANNALKELERESPGLLERPVYGDIAYSMNQLQLLSDNFLQSQTRLFRVNREGPGRSLKEILDATVAEYTYQAESQGLSLVSSATRQAEAVPLGGTAEAFRHTLRILVSNAVRHTDHELATKAKDFTITVTARKRDSNLVVTVKNVGSLPEDFKIGTIHDDVIESPIGMHLGLPIARDWVDAVAGQLTLSVSDHSVIAEVTWPAIQAERKGAV